MKRHLPVSVNISVHIHATESEEKVIKAIKNILPSDIELIEFDILREEFKGHHGNPIKRLELSLNNAKKVKSIYTNMLKRLKGLKYEGWISERFDNRKNKLYLRLDKQSAFLGDIKLGGGDDVIRVVFTFPGYHKIRGEELEKEISEGDPSE